MTGKHTETPWVVSSSYLVLTKGGKIVANLVPDIWIPSLHPQISEQEANAAYIVRAVNAHEGLVRALSSIAEDCRRGSNEHGMTPAGVRDIAFRCDAAISAAKE